MTPKDQEPQYETYARLETAYQYVSLRVGATCDGYESQLTREIIDKQTFERLVNEAKDWAAKEQARLGQIAVAKFPDSELAKRYTPKSQDALPLAYGDLLYELAKDTQKAWISGFLESANQANEGRIATDARAQFEAINRLYLLIVRKQPAAADNRFPLDLERIAEGVDREVSLAELEQRKARLAGCDGLIL